MPQARSGGSSGGGSSGSSSSGGTGRSRSTGSRSTGSRSGGSRSGTSRASSSRSSRSTAAKRPAAKRSTSARSGTTKAKPKPKPKPGSPEARVEAAANRVRKLNEQIIDAGKQAGESTLTSYEKFLKSIAGSIERGPGASDVEWIANLATAQAKFIRDVTASLTKAARKTLK